MFSVKHKLAFGAAIALAAVIASGARLLDKRAARAIDEARAAVGGDTIRHERTPMIPPRARGAALWQSASATRSAAVFRDSYFAATDGGLVRYSAAGEELRRYGVLDGLPESDLTALAVFDDRLYIGTRAAGLLAFDGEGFERYRWLDREAQAVTALAVDAGRLLVATFAGGLLEFDDGNFREITARADGGETPRLRGIICLDAADGRLFVGTFADGLWLRDAARWRQFKKEDGLPSARVVGVAEIGGTIYAATDAGLAACESEATAARPASRCREIAPLAAVSGSARVGSTLVVVRDDGRLYEAASGDAHSSGDRTRRAALVEVPWQRPAALTDARLIVFDECLWVLGSRGMWRARVEEDAERSRSAPRLAGVLASPFERFGGREAAEPLESNTISALACDRDGYLWAGTFRDGIDLLDERGRRQEHFESEALREVNGFAEDERGGRMYVATSGGVQRLDKRQGARAQPVAAATGLAGASVAGLWLGAEAEARAGWYATSRGLSFGDDAGATRTLTTVQGLPSDNACAVAGRGSTIYVGTLGGLAEIERGRVTRVWTSAGSRLANNWVSALRFAGERLFVGTYGGGVYELTAAGELRSFADEIGSPRINPNAMWADDERLYVGTTAGAWVYDLRSGVWRRVRRVLPSQTVLSVAGDGEQVYFGTTSGIARLGREFWSGEDEDR